VEINENALAQFLLFNDKIVYSEDITLYPVKMENIFQFQQYITSFTVRKNSIFPVKDILKMSYLDFLFYCTKHEELAIQYKIPYLPYLYGFAFLLLKLVCVGQDVKYSESKGLFQINNEIVTPEKFDDLRRIIIIQNNVNFDIDEFIHYDTEQELIKAQEYENKKNKEKYTIEDYIDSYIIAMGVTEKYVKNLTIRKFWRYIKRISKHESYQIMQTASCSGMVTFKEPIKYWMASIDEKNTLDNLKVDEKDLRSKMG
jgi:hypothetical protein